MCWAQGKYTEAEGLFKRALAIREKALGVNHADVVARSTTVALRLWSLAKYTEAEGLQTCAGDPRKSARREPCRRGETFNNLALVYGAQANYTEAEEP